MNWLIQDHAFQSSEPRTTSQREAGDASRTSINVACAVCGETYFGHAVIPESERTWASPYRGTGMATYPVPADVSGQRQNVRATVYDELFRDSPATPREEQLLGLLAKAHLELGHLLDFRNAVTRELADLEARRTASALH